MPLEATMENTEPHVHFDASCIKSENDSDSCVTYQRQNDTIIVSLGFLQINHRYMVDLKLPTSLFAEYPNITQFVPDVNTTVPNLHCRIQEFSGLKHKEQDFFEMKIEFFAYKEKLLKETVTIVNLNNDNEIFKLVLSARVLGKGMGTPMLRNGIHCLGPEKNEETSAANKPGLEDETQDIVET